MSDEAQNEAPKPLTFPGIILTPEALALRVRVDAAREQVHQLTVLAERAVTAGDTVSSARLRAHRDALKGQCDAVESTILTV